MSSRTIVLTLFFLCPVLAFSQSLQLHYDLRHTIDPKYTRKNYPAFYFEYFISFDSAKGFIKPGAFLLKVQTELTGEKHNTGQFYMQVSQTFRFWKPKVFLQLQYNGGLGIAEPGAYGYYLTNAFSLGAAYPFRSKNMKAFFNAYISYKYTDFKKPSHDMISAFYWLLFFSNYSINFSGNLVFLTENRNHGDGLTNNLSGKKFLFYGDPQIWFRLIKGFSAGTRLNLFYHILRENNSFQAYPTIGVRYQF